MDFSIEKSLDVLKENYLLIIVFAILGYALSSYLNLDFKTSLLLSTILPIYALMFKIFYKKIVHLQKIKSIENSIPDFFMELSIYQSYLLTFSIEKIISLHLTSKDNDKLELFSNYKNLLYRELSFALEKEKLGFLLEDSLDEISKKYKSTKIENMLFYLKLAYICGTDFRETFRDIAINYKKKRSNS